MKILIENEKNLLKWAVENFPWLGYVVMASLGGVVAHIRNYEAQGKVLTLKQHLFGSLLRVIVSGFAALLMYYIMLWQFGTADKPLGYLCAGLVGHFAPEALDLMWSIVKKNAQTRSLSALGVPTTEKIEKKP